MVFRVGPDANAQTLALLAGEADYLGLVNAQDVERLRAKADLTLAQTAFGTGGGNCINTLGFNLDRKALADLRVRQAIAHAIDRTQLLRDVQFGIGKVPTAPISSGLAWPGRMRQAHWPATHKACNVPPSCSTRPACHPVPTACA